MCDDQLWTGRETEVVAPGEAGAAGTTRLGELHHAIPPNQPDGAKAISLCARWVLVWGQRPFDTDGAAACLDCAEATRSLSPPTVDGSA